MSLSKKPEAFFDIDPPFSKRKNARFAILPAPYERSSSYLKGCAKGPAAIKKASAQVELYEPDVGVEPYRQGIYAAPAVRFGKGSDAKELDRIRKAAEPYIDEGKFLVTLGGEHTIAVPLVKLYCEKHKNITVLQIDAHPDLRDTYEGNPLSHACVGRRIIEHAPLAQVGVRSWCIEQAEFMKKASKRRVGGQKALTVFPAKDIVGKRGWQRKVVDCLSENVYLTLDLDVLDPSVIPAVGTPEPGGIGWYETLDLLKELIRRKRLVGMDIVELKPIKGDTRCDIAAARLLHHTLAYITKYCHLPQRR